MKRTVPAAALVVLLLTGCEEQEAVPLSRSMPVALLQLAVLLGAVVGGHLLLERHARRRAPRPALDATTDRGALDVIGAIAFSGLSLTVTAIMALAILSIPETYAEGTIDVFSWEESVGLVWVLLVPLVPFALFELRLAAACWSRRRWAAWGAGLQVLLVVGSFLWSTAPSA